MAVTVCVRSFHIDLAKIQTAEGKLYLYVEIDRTSKLALVQVVRKTGLSSASAFLMALITAVPYQIYTVLTDNGIQVIFPRRSMGTWPATSSTCLTCAAK